MDPLLPRDDEDLDGRRRRLERARERYVFSYTHPPGIAKASSVPVADRYSPAFLLRVLRLRLKVTANHASSRFAELFTDDELDFDHDGDEDSLFERVAAAPGELFERVVGNSRRRAEAQAEVRLDSLDDYYEMFSTLDPPAIVKLWRRGAAARDLGFAWQRIAGVNPMVMHRVSQLPDHFPVTDADLAASLPGDSLAAAGAEGRLYLTDYAMLDNVPLGRGIAGQPKWVWAPMAAFVWSAKEGQLRPVAIQCAQRPSPNCPIWTPRDGWRWEMAKTVVQSADGNHHQAIAHLAWTHLMMEPFVVAAHRQLSVRHPVHILLAPHFEFTLAINDTAANNLIQPGGEVEVVLAGTLEGSLGAAAKELADWRLDQALPPVELRNRGLDDVERLPVMPYRDEGLPVWAAIHDWVESYLRLYYVDDVRVRTDPELQAWVREVASQDGGRLPGVGTIDTFAALCDLVSFVIWTASAQHSAVNFAQYDFLGFIPNVPGASFAPAPRPDTPNTEAAWLAMLPPLGETIMQSDAVYQLAGVRANHLGEYGRFYFDDRAVRPLMRAFQDRLDALEDGADARDATRLLPYPYLRPSNITASVHI